MVAGGYDKTVGRAGDRGQDLGEQLHLHKNPRVTNGGWIFETEGWICNVKPHRGGKKEKDSNCPKEWAVLM